MEDGKVNKALKLLESANKGEILQKETFEVLLEKHPKASNDILVEEEEVQNVHPVIYDSIDSEIVRDAIKKSTWFCWPFGFRC